MPTKPNSAGEQQDYVPAGNGDPSGEYADEVGANVHFQVFKKPADQSAVKGVIAEGKAKEEMKIKVDQKAQAEQQHKTFSDYVDSNFKGKKTELKEKIKTDFSFGDPDSQKVLLDSFNGTGTSFTPSKKDCCVMLGSAYVQTQPLVKLSSGGGLQDNHYSKGGVFYHECGHAIDAIYSQQGIYDEKYNIKGWVPASYSVKLSNGKTLAESINEFRKDKGITQTYALAKKAVEDKTKEILESNPEYKKKKAVLDQLREQRESAVKKYVDERDSLNKRYHNNEITGVEYWRAMDDIDSRQSADKTLQEISAKINDNSVFGIEANAKGIIDQEFGDISDMFEASYGLSLTGMGHGSRYWGKDRMKRGAEFFAEYVSARATNQASMKRIQEYFPEQAKQAEELYSKIAKGELKKWNQK